MEQQSLTYLLRKIVIKTKRQADSFVAEYGLTAQQGRTIDFIASHEQAGVIQQDIARMFGLQKATITSLIQGLEQKGYIERRASPTDDRKKMLYVLEKGRVLIEQFLQTAEQVEAELLKPLTLQERRTLASLLHKIDKNFDKDDRNDKAPNNETR